MNNLLSIVVNQAGFEYDIHSLVKAFYPAQDVKVFVSDSDDGENNVTSSGKDFRISPLSFPERKFALV